MFGWFLSASSARIGPEQAPIVENSPESCQIRTDRPRRLLLALKQARCRVGRPARPASEPPHDHRPSWQLGPRRWQLTADLTPQPPSPLPRPALRHAMPSPSERGARRRRAPPSPMGSAQGFGVIHNAAERGAGGVRSAGEGGMGVGGLAHGCECSSYRQRLLAQRLGEVPVEARLAASVDRLRPSVPASPPPALPPPAPAPAARDAPRRSPSAPEARCR